MFELPCVTTNKTGISFVGLAERRITVSRGPDGGAFLSTFADGADHCFTLKPEQVRHLIGLLAGPKGEPS